MQHTCLPGELRLWMVRMEFMLEGMWRRYTNQDDQHQAPWCKWRQGMPIFSRLSTATSDALLLRTFSEKT